MKRSIVGKVVNGTLAGGIEDESGNSVVDVLLDNGVVHLGVHDGEYGALQALTPNQAVWIARLLLNAAWEANRVGVPLEDSGNVATTLSYLE